MKGVYAAIVTHFDQELQVDHDAVAAQVSRLVAAGVHGIVPNGTVGEGGSLTRDERRAVVETAVAAAGQAPVCAGVSAATAEQASEYARDARSSGAESVMALPPLLYRADRRELVEFFGSVAQAADLPLLIYNNPASSGSDMPPELLAELAREVPSIAAIKETSGDARRIAHLVNLCPDLDILVGGDDWALEGFAAGAAGWVSGVVDILRRVRAVVGSVPGRRAGRRADSVRRAASAVPARHDAEARAVLQGWSGRDRRRWRAVPLAAVAAHR